MPAMPPRKRASSYAQRHSRQLEMEDPRLAIRCQLKKMYVRGARTPSPRPLDMSDPGLFASLHQLLSVQNLSLVCAGIYFQDLIAHLDFDWDLLRRPEKDRAPAARIAKWTYLACRFLLIIAELCQILLTFLSQADCGAMIKLQTISSFLSISCCSSLLSIRVAAVWRWDKRIIAVLTAVLLALLGFLIYLCVGELTFNTHGASIDGCTFGDVVHVNLPPSIGILVCDCTICTLLLAGLQFKWRDARDFRMWRILWSQGLLYLFLATAVEVPALVLLILNLSDAMDGMLVTVEVLVLGIGATRMFRSLNATVREDEDAEHFTHAKSIPGHHDDDPSNGIRLRVFRRR
ncbi:unnamed protein product [Peniophora sp. CBMAI 1063]|nr:unnamed protein product [Peniophora sp. CBMAI 1063]